MYSPMKSRSSMSSSIRQHISDIKSELPDGVELVAVSKFHPIEALRDAYEGGQRLFGENRVQELLEKVPLMPDDVEWHLIGTLQRNKVKYIVPFIHTIHSVDSPRLLTEIEKQAERQDVAGVRILFQVDVTDEDTKHGFIPDDLLAWLNTGEYSSLTHIRYCGLMAMAALTEDRELIERQFSTVHELFERIRSTYFPDSSDFTKLSMGMTSDYTLALKYGANYVRIGSAIFGPREY